MTRAADLDEWQHHSGYRLGIDKSIEYRRDDGARVWIEGLRPDPAFLPDPCPDDVYEDNITYWGCFRVPNDDGTHTDHGPKFFDTEEKANAWLTETIETNRLETPEP